jgi:fido (protein-threonine AMPylation protein)
MSTADLQQLDLEEYLHKGKPSMAQHADAWQVAIGLQAVDCLTVSDYLIATAREHIEGTITMDEAQRQIQSYHMARDSGNVSDDEDTREADIVSSRIVSLLEERAFSLSPTQLKTIHGTLFEGLLATPGTYRTYNITKREPVLQGDTVWYAPANTIEATLNYDVGCERNFSYRGHTKEATVRHIASFISGIWQIHPFEEGNTRTTAVFAMRYLRSRGFKVDSEPFKRFSLYFRNALVRANYENHTAGIYETQEYLDLFFDNLLLGEHHELKNRCLHIDHAVRRIDPVSRTTHQSAG